MRRAKGSSAAVLLLPSKSVRTLLLAKEYDRDFAAVQCTVWSRRRLGLSLASCYVVLPGTVHVPNMMDFL
jgi:hypothetical protein